MSVDGTYSCETPAKTLKWIHAIIDFLKPYRFFLDAHVVNFFKDKLWEAVDKDWMDCLRCESVDTLLRIPSGCVQVYWPASLKKFVLISRSLAISREQADLPKVFPDLPLVPLNNVLTQGMNGKKKHEIEALAAIVSSIAKQTQASTIVDVGAGQGYLAQVLSFEYQLPVTAIDACSHHGRTTDARAERIRKYYASKMRKSGLEKKHLSMPKTVTCRVLSTDMLKALSCPVAQKGEEKIGDQINGHEAIHSCLEDRKSTLLLAGLHACGDLSVTMLRTFLECNEVKAVVSIGCCYNLLSEGDGNGELHSGFPASKGVKCAGFVLGKSARDLACQSAERWANSGGAAGLHNFELHAFRAAFQMVLLRHYPETLMSSPTIGRQGKALRRQQNRKVLESSFRHESIDSINIQSNGNCKKRDDSLVVESSEAANEEGMHEVDIRDPAHEPCGTRGSVGSVSSGDGFLHGASCYKTDNSGEAKPVNKYPLFEKFCQSGLQRLDLHHSEELEFAGLWKEAEPFTELIGPYWSLRAALGPVVETMLLLDRLLLIQEQDDIRDAHMVPIFDPVLSPRNIALVWPCLPISWNSGKKTGRVFIVKEMTRFKQSSPSAGYRRYLSRWIIFIGITLSKVALAGIMYNSFIKVWNKEFSSTSSFIIRKGRWLYQLPVLYWQDHTFSSGLRRHLSRWIIFVGITLSEVALAGIIYNSFIKFGTRSLLPIPGTSLAGPLILIRLVQNVNEQRVLLISLSVKSLMSNLSMVEAKLPPGFRFHPRDEELICDYLMKKMTSSESCPFLIEVDLNKCEPWDIPVTACVGGKEWYFYSQRDRKYATGLRTNRATISGYWKATGKDRLILRRGTLVGMRKTLVFYQGRAPKGRKTEWVMHEFRLEGPLGPPKIPSSKDDWVLCRVFYKSKEAVAKQGMRLSSSYDDTISSSSLPPLMDSYITFDQTLPNQSHQSHNQEHDHEHVDDDHNQLANPSTNQDQYEQVPCFSNFTQNQISQTFSHITHMDPNMSIPSTTTKSSVTSAPTFGGLPQFVSSSSCLTPLISSSCDKKVLQAVLNHFTKLETINNNNNNLMMIKGGSPGFGDGISDSDQNFLSDVVLPTSIWNNHY